MTPIQTRAQKSRRDETLLTVDAIYGRDAACHVSTSRAATALGTGDCEAGAHQVSSLRDFAVMRLYCRFRRLKPPVNKMPSLRDFSSLINFLGYIFLVPELKIFIMKKQILILSLLATFGISSQAREYHVSIKGNDNGTGSESAPTLVPPTPTESVEKPINVMNIIASMPSYRFPEDFAVGATFAWLPHFENLGAKYRDRNGIERDFVDILKNDYNINTVRLHVFVDPNDNPWWGTSDNEYTLSVAKRAQDYGMRISLVLMYCDTWGNAGSQPKPAAWMDLSYDELVAKVEAYSRETVQFFMDNGVMPEWVELGNETNLGILLPDGEASEANMERIAKLYSAGNDGVKAASPESKTLIHLSNCELTDYMCWYYQWLKEYDCRYDMIGFSFYPHSNSGMEWSGMLKGLENTLKQLTQYTKKPIMIVEVGFDHRNPDEERDKFLQVLEVIHNAPETAQQGIIYWEPGLISELYSKAGEYYEYGAWGDDMKPTAIMDAYLSLCK